MKKQFAMSAAIVLAATGAGLSGAKAGGVDPIATRQALMAL
ncbi:MAG TPA: hypothetical protein VGM32_05395 [Rhodopila sp.]|jgi:hypothetical protein